MKQAEKTACFTGHRDIKPEHLGTVRNNLFSIEGDFNMVSVAEVERLMQGDASGRVQR